MEMWKVVHQRKNGYWQEIILTTAGEGRTTRSLTEGRIDSLTRPKWDLVKNGWKWRTIRCWNRLPVTIRQVKFKHLLRNWVKINVPKRT